MVALQLAIDRYAGYVAAVVRHTVKATVSHEDVEELVSDVFLLLWNNAGNLRRGSRLKAWLAVVTRNRALRWARSMHFAVELTDEVLAEVLANKSGQKEDPEGAWESQQDIARAFKQLKPGEQQLLQRYYYDDQSIAHIAQESQSNIQTVKSRLHRSRKKLRTALIKGRQSI
jgi:RNA polymerase sigma-70 factor (ECF subfamily)